MSRINSLAFWIRRLALSCVVAGVALGALAPQPAVARDKEAKKVFVETWTDPEAQPLQLKGSTVVAAVMIQDPKARQKAEDALAREITRLGGKGIAMYKISADTAISEEGQSKTRAAVEKVGAKGLVVMRPVDIQHKARQTDTISNDSVYGGYWDGYYGYGWADPWIMKNPDVQTDLVITVETFVFSLPQNKLVWTGTSETTNPKNAEKLVHKIATDGVRELQALGLLKK
ncbi:MAG TPA: hypothetical protein VFL16_15655 [Steroidobacteraceae bacterium]|jgi:hypothetical protein|nr:hypothetical protein [Steroidobacteraceae bacterium]